MTILGYDISYLELFASISSLVAVILATRVSLWNWPIGIIGQILFFILFLNTQLYGNMILQVFFTGVSIYGWYYWNKKDDRKIKVISTKKSLSLITSIIFCCIVGTFILNENEVEYAFLDATTTILSVFAVFLLSKKYLESWILWIIVDILSIILFKLKGINLISLEYIIITFFATYGLINWIKLYKNEKRISIR